MENIALVTINSTSYTIEELEKDCWLRLLNGSLRSKDDFHTGSVATLKDSEVSLRTVVLRKVIPSQKEVWFHTDIRSPKWAELKKNNTISMLFYSRQARMQIRVFGSASLHYQDEIKEIAWTNTSLSSRRCYLGNTSPSSHVGFPSDGLENIIGEGNLSPEASEKGKKNFGVVSVHVKTMDWLWLNHAGHRRALFDYTTRRYTWLTP
jgi:pyridoxamine 5'-phosphate oxidase